MKGLSIEQKAKRYDEALEKSKRLYEQGTITESLCYVFPELKESEDEKVRKAIIAILSNYVDNSNTFKPKMLAWLEKQRTSYTKSDVDDAYLKGISDAKNELEKQGEQKQYDIDVLEKHITKDSISELAHTVIVRNGWEIVDAKEQEPAWSEKDEKEYKYVLKFVDNILNNCGNKKDYEHCKRCYDWLKSLKQKIGG